MTFTAPFTAVPGEIITAAGHNTSVRDNLNHLRGVTGGDPGASGFALVSTGPQSAAWQKIADAVLLDQKVSRASYAVADFNSVAQIGSNGFYAGTDAVGSPALNGTAWYVLTQRHPNASIDFRWQLAVNANNPSLIYHRLIIAGAPTGWGQIWSAHSHGSNTGMNADMLDGFNAGHSAGQIPISDGTYNANLVADKLWHSTLGALALGNGSNQVPVSNAIMNVGLNAQYIGGLMVADLDARYAPPMTANSIQQAAGVVVTATTAFQGILQVALGPGTWEVTIDGIYGHAPQDLAGEIRCDRNGTTIGPVPEVGNWGAQSTNGMSYLFSVTRIVAGNGTVTFSGRKQGGTGTSVFGVCNMSYRRVG